MTGGSGKDGRGGNGEKPRSSNSRSEKGKSANAPSKLQPGDVIATTQAGPIVVSGFVQQQAGQKPYEFVYNRYGGFSSGKYAATYDHEMAQRNPPPPVKTSSGSSGASLASSQANRVSATPPPEFKAPTKPRTSKGPIESGGCPPGVQFSAPSPRSPKVSSSKSTTKKVKLEPIEQDATAAVVSPVVQSLSDEHQFAGGDVKQETLTLRQRRERMVDRHTPTHAASTAFTAYESVGGQSAAASSSSQPVHFATMPQHQIHQPQPQHHFAQTLPSFDTLTPWPTGVSSSSQQITPGYHGSQQSDMASGSRQQMHIIPLTQPADLLDANIFVDSSAFDNVDFPADSSVGGSSEFYEFKAKVEADNAYMRRQMEQTNALLARFVQAQMGGQQQAHPSAFVATPAPVAVHRSGTTPDEIEDSIDFAKKDSPQHFQEPGSDAYLAYIKNQIETTPGDANVSGGGDQFGHEGGGDQFGHGSGNGSPAVDDKAAISAKVNFDRRESGTVFRALPDINFWALDLALPIKARPLMRQLWLAGLDLAREPKPEPKKPNHLLNLPRPRYKRLPDEVVYKPRLESVKRARLVESCKVPYRSPVTAAALSTLAKVARVKGSSVTGLLITNAKSFQGVIARRSIAKATDDSPEESAAIISNILSDAKKADESNNKAARKRKTDGSGKQPAKKAIKQEVNDDVMSAAEAMVAPDGSPPQSDAGDREDEPTTSKRKRSASSVGSSSVAGEGDGASRSGQRVKKTPVLKDVPAASGGSFPTLKMRGNFNHAIYQMQNLIGLTVAEVKLVNAKIKQCVTDQLKALKNRIFPVGDPRRLTTFEQRHYHAIIDNPSLWDIDNPVPPGVYIPPVTANACSTDEGVRAKQFGGFQFVFDHQETAAMKGFQNAAEILCAQLSPTRDVNGTTWIGLPEFYRLEHSSAKLPEVFVEVDCTAEVVKKCFKNGGRQLRDITIAINGDFYVLPLPGESSEAAKKRAKASVSYLLKKEAENYPTITLKKPKSEDGGAEEDEGEKVLKLVWMLKPRHGMVHEALWPWLEKCCNSKQIFTRYADAPFDPINGEQEEMEFDQSCRHSLLGYALGRGHELCMSHASVAVAPGTVFHKGQNVAKLPSHHYTVEGAFVDYVFADAPEVDDLMRTELYPGEFQYCKRWDQHRRFIFNPDYLHRKGKKFVMNIRKPGQLTNVLPGGYLFSISFGGLESIGVDCLSAPVTWQATHRPFLDPINCNHGDNSIVERNLGMFDGAFNSLVTMQDKTALVMKDPINSCYGCYQQPDMDATAKQRANFKHNHFNPFKSGDIPRSGCCTKPKGRFTLERRLEFQESNEKMRARRPITTADMGAAIAAVVSQQPEIADDARKAVEVTPGSETRPTEQKETVDVAAIKKEKKTPAKESPKAKGQKKPEKEDPAKSETSADLTANEPGSSGTVPITPPPLTKKQKAKKDKQEKTKKPDEPVEEDVYREPESEKNKPLPEDADKLGLLDDGGRNGNGEQDDTAPLEIVTEPVIGGDPKPTETDELMKLEPAAGGDPQSGGDLSESDQPQVNGGDLMNGDRGGEPPVNGDAKTAENKGEQSPIVDIEGENDSGGDGDGSDDENGSGYDTDAPNTDDGRSMVGDPPVHRVEVGVGKSSDAKNDDEENEEEDDEEFEEVEADDEEEEEESDEDEDDPMEED